MSAACPLIVCPDVCYLLGFQGKTMIKALKTFDIDPKHWPAMAANRNNWRHRINK
jgi:hypothetical protein